MEGSVLFFDRKKGFGFAAPRDRGGDVYIHHSQLPQNHRYLNEDDRVIFDVGPIVKNHRVALRVQIIREAPQSNGGGQ